MQFWFFHPYSIYSRILSYYIIKKFLHFFTKLCCVSVVCVSFFLNAYVVRKVNIAVKNDFNSLNEEWQKRKKLIVGIMRSVNIFFHALCWNNNNNNNNNIKPKRKIQKIKEIYCTWQKSYMYDDIDFCLCLCSWHTILSTYFFFVCFASLYIFAEINLFNGNLFILYVLFCDVLSIRKHIHSAEATHKCFN